MNETTAQRPAENKMGVMPINRLLITMSLPMIVSMLVQALYNIVDSMFVAQLSENALTAVSLAFPVQSLMIAVGSGTGVGINALLSKSLGEKNFDLADKTAENGIFLAVLSYLLFAVIGVLFSKPFFLLQTTDPEIVENGAIYLMLCCVCSFGMFLQFTFERLLQSTGRTKLAMYTQIAGAVINIILDPIFIFGFGMGVKGAALATIISQAVSCGWVLAFLTGKKTFLRIKKEYLKPVPSIVFPCLALGLSTFVMQSSESVISVCFNSSLLKYGGDLAVGAMTILTSTMQFAMLPLQGIGQGAQPIMSYNYGARNIDRMKKTFKLHLVISLIYSTLFWLFVQLFPATFAGIFSSDPELVSFTAGALRIYCGAMFLFGIQLACQMTFVAIGYAVCSIIVAVVRKFVLLLPLIFIVPIFVSNKTMGVYMAEPIADAIAVTFTAILFSIQFKKALKKLDKA